MTDEEFLALSDERQLWHQRITDAWHAGLAHGEAIHAGDYARGYTTAITEMKAADRNLVRALATHATIWAVRGQQRTRHTFAQPHPSDYPGSAP